VSVDGLPLLCPDRQILFERKQTLSCARSHRYHVALGVPVLLRDVPETLWVLRRSLAAAWADVEWRNADPRFLATLGIADGPRDAPRAALAEATAIEPVVSHVLLATNGRLYRPRVGRHSRYPIPSRPIAVVGMSDLLSRLVARFPLLGRAADRVLGHFERAA
jgi:hypothetical protein